VLGRFEDGKGRCLGDLQLMASVADSIPPVSAKAARILLLSIPVVKNFLVKFSFHP